MSKIITVEDCKPQKSHRFLWFVSIVAACGGLLFGYDAVVVSGTNSQVVEQFGFSASQLGFYVSCVLWGCMVGSGFAGPFSDRFGRKSTLLVSAILIFISATWSGMASSVNQLIIARLIGGLGIGCATMVCPLYISEISPKEIRGRLVTLYQLLITVGIVFCVFINWGIFSFAESNSETTHLNSFISLLFVDENWRAMFLAEAIPGLLFLTAAIFIPESPRWLVKQHKTEEALKVLLKFNTKERAQEVCNDIEEVVHEESNVKLRDLFTEKLRFPLIMAVVLCFFSEASGCSVVFYYGPQIFEDAGFGMGGSLGGFATIAIVNFIATLFALRFVDSAGRKKLLIVGIIGCILSHLLIFALFTTGQTGWPIIIAINLFVAFFACALGPVKYVFVSEIFPTQIRGKAIAISTITIWMASATVAQLFPMMQEIMPTGFIFLGFVIELAIFLPIVILKMPETKGKTIEEIEVQWLKK